MRNVSHTRSTSAIALIDHTQVKHSMDLVVQNYGARSKAWVKCCLVMSIRMRLVLYPVESEFLSPEQGPAFILQ